MRKIFFICLIVLVADITAQNSPILIHEEYVFFNNGENIIHMTLFPKDKKVEIKINSIHDSLINTSIMEGLYDLKNNELIIVINGKTVKLNETKATLKIGRLETSTIAYTCFFSEVEEIKMKSEFLKKYEVDTFLFEIGLKYK